MSTVRLFLFIVLASSANVYGDSQNVDITGVWSGVQQGKYKVKATFNIEHDTVTDEVQGTAQFENTERPVTADAEIREGRVEERDGKMFVDLLVHYKTGLQADTGVKFRLQLVSTDTLAGSGRNDWGTNLSLNLVRKAEK